MNWRIVAISILNLRQGTKRGIAKINPCADEVSITPTMVDPETNPSCLVPGQYSFKRTGRGAHGTRVPFGAMSISRRPSGDGFHCPALQNMSSEYK